MGAQFLKFNRARQLYTYCSVISGKLHNLLQSLSLFSYRVGIIGQHHGSYRLSGRQGTAAIC